MPGRGGSGRGEGAGRLSQDDIVFEEVRYREPVRTRRPDRDRRWACLAYEVPGPGDLPVFLDRAPADAIERHALRDTSVELGGILLGKECVDDLTGEPFVRVTRSLEAKHYENTQASFTYTHDSWEEITRERDRLYPDLDVVGWYHTHPDFGVFLSSHDLFIQRHFFGQPLQLAYVVDPVRQTRGFFQWRAGAMEQVGGFFLTADRGERLALSRLANDLEQIPDAEPGGGGLSPRLEAELIAMLSRPATAHHAHHADRAQAAVLFAMLGAALGVAGLAGLLWLNGVNQQVRQQSQSLQKLEGYVRESVDQQRVAFDAAAGDTAPEKFLERFAKAARERDEARQRLANQESVNDLLATRARRLADDLDKSKADLDDAARRAEANEADAKRADDYRARLAELETTAGGQAKTIRELEAVLDTAEGRRAAAMTRKYKNAWMAAVAGWALSAFLAIAGLAAYALAKPPPGDAAVPPPAPDPDEPPPHRIV